MHTAHRLVKLARALLIIVLAIASAGVSAAPKVDRIEPPNWWVGMQEPNVQLMLHGKDIATAQVDLQYEGVRIAQITRSVSSNYLFVDLQIAPNAVPGIIVLTLWDQRGVATLSYPLKARSKGAANRQGFSERDVILNLMPDRFANGDPQNDSVSGLAEIADRTGPHARHGGDLAGLTQHLDYIKEMGFTMVWPTPLIENAQASYSYHGYAATDFYNIDARFGGNAAYLKFMTQARKQGIGVIQDIVLNHIGSGHWWMQDLPSPDWIGFANTFVPTQHARTTITDPYASAIDRRQFSQGWFVESMPDLNQRNKLLASYLIQNTIWWIEYAGLSGLRIDTFSYSDAAFLVEWTSRVRAEYPRLGIVGEEWSTNPSIVAKWLEGQSGWAGASPGMPNMMDFPLSETLRSALVEPDTLDTGLGKLYAMLANDGLYAKPSKLVLFEGNHDMPRLFSVLDKDEALLRMALVFLTTSKRIPQFYYGTEVLMESPKTRDDAAARRDFPGGWAGDTVNAFTGAGLSQSQRDMQRFVRQLLNWRKGASAVHSGKLLHYLPENGIYVYFRSHAAQRLMVVLNKNPESQALNLARFEESLAGAKLATDVLSKARFSLDKTLAVPARSAMILELSW